ncbi:hypothetical protein [Kordiimonas aquimaris]|uniref:hypothetical protein n=1 Tax=Kordiimonas aquimaris TaxID=707591 RepID=UPI0021CFA80C|nr:hypothetical protein [Kordiimonas aquimaris]
MRRILQPVLILAFALSMTAVNAQEGEKTYNLKEGQVIDFLFLTRRQNSGEALNDYARQAISVARALDYKSLSGFDITRKPTQGNYYPEVLIFGGWPGDFQDRADALTALKEAVPDLNERRLDIWSRFDMTNYQLTEDKSFTVSYDKIQVLTAYWQKDAGLFAKFKREFLEKTKETGGIVKLELTDPRSPFGYDYTPEYTIITEWDNQAGFDAFLAKNLAMNHAGVKHVNQFYLTPPKPKK